MSGVYGDSVYSFYGTAEDYRNFRCPGLDMAEFNAFWDEHEVCLRLERYWGLDVRHLPRHELDNVLSATCFSFEQIMAMTHKELMTIRGNKIDAIGNGVSARPKRMYAGLANRIMHPLHPEIWRDWIHLD